MRGAWCVLGMKHLSKYRLWVAVSAYFRAESGNETGEGKTLVTTLPAYLNNGLTGRGCNTYI